MCCVKISSPLPPAADDLWSMSDIYCNNLPIATMLMPTPRKTPAVNTETGLVPEPDAVDVLPINWKRQTLFNLASNSQSLRTSQSPNISSLSPDQCWAVLHFHEEPRIPVVKYIY